MRPQIKLQVRLAVTLTAITLISVAALAQNTASVSSLPMPPAAVRSTPLPEDRGAAALVESLRRLSTWGSLMMIVAHPDDEDGAMLTYESRGQGIRVSQLTLTRGEGGQNAMSADNYDALGLIRTQELMEADEYYGIRQYFGTEADFGFSKTKEESYVRWGHDRVLYDAVLAVRRERPLILVSSFVGGVTDGHGHHQVSGEIAQKVFTAAGDPTVFPEQFKDGLRPWSPLAVYSLVPFAPITDKGMFDYATNKWEPARFYNYVTRQWSNETPSTDVTIPVGTDDAILGLSYVQVARTGWGRQLSQYGGAVAALSGPQVSHYHLWATHAALFSGSAGSFGTASTDSSFLDNSHLRVATDLRGLTLLLHAPSPSWLTDGLSQIADGLAVIVAKPNLTAPQQIAEQIAPLYAKTIELRARIASSDLQDEAGKANLLEELDRKLTQFQTALAAALQIDIAAFRAKDNAIAANPALIARGQNADETPRTVSAGDTLNVRVHTSQSMPVAHFKHVWLTSNDGSNWNAKSNSLPAQSVSSEEPQTHDAVFQAIVPQDAQPTAPPFTRPAIEQPYYDVANQALRGDPLAPWPLVAWVEYEYHGLPIRVGQVVQAMHREPGRGGVFAPLVVVPHIGVRITPAMRVLTSGNKPFPVDVLVHAEGAAIGTVTLNLPAGWHVEPEQASFRNEHGGDSDPIRFMITPEQTGTGFYTIQATAHSSGRDYTTGWQAIGYPGLPTYNLYRPAQIKTRAIDVRTAPNLKVAYIMGTGDTVPGAIEQLGIHVDMLQPSLLAGTDLNQWDAILLGIRSYSAHPELVALQAKLNAFVEQGGVLINFYQREKFPAPYSITLSASPENVVEESAAVKILDPANPLLNWPNHITSTDFDQWVEERGHSFAGTWDKHYTPLTETADAGQEPQSGGLLVARYGKGFYIYTAYALYRQLPELVPGAYRILANLLSAGKEAQAPDAIENHPRK